MPGDHADLEEGVVRISVEQVNGELLPVVVDWLSNQRLTGALAELADAWKRSGTYPGDGDGR